MIFINFKSSYEGTGERAIRLIKAISEIQEKTKIKIVPTVHDFDVYPIRQIYDGELWVQHASDPETVLDLNLKINGTFLNHSDFRYEDWNELALAVKDCRNFGLKSLVFAAIEGETIKICRMKPEFIAYEPPELIGSSEKSVASEDSDVIKKAAEICKGFNIPLVVGAGIHSKEDVRKSLEMGAIGVAVSSFIVDSNEPKKALLELVGGFDGAS